VKSIRQQLEQSGLIAAGPSEGFSQLLSAAAEHLSAPPFHTLMLAGSSLGINNSYEWTHTIALLRAWDILLGMYDVGEPRCTFAAATAPAAWQLISRLWQRFSTEVQQIQEPTAPHHAVMMSAMLFAVRATKAVSSHWIAAWDLTFKGVNPQSLLGALQEKPVPSSEQIILAPQFLQCLAILEAVLALHMQVEGRLHAASSSGSSTSGNDKTATTASKPSSSSSSGVSTRRAGGIQQGTPLWESLTQPESASGTDSPRSNDALQAWQQSQGLQSVLTSSDHKLFELLGTNSKAVLWAAVGLRQGPLSMTPEVAGAWLTIGSIAHLQMLQCILSAQQQQQPQPRQQQLQQQQGTKKKKKQNKQKNTPSDDEASAQQQLSGLVLSNEQLHLQLACLQLRCAARLLQYESMRMDTALYAAKTGRVALHLWELTDGRLAAGTWPVTPEELVQFYQQYSSRTEPSSQEEQVAAIAATVELLPQVLQLLGAIQKQSEGATSAAALTAAGAFNISGSSSSSSHDSVMQDLHLSSSTQPIQSSSNGGSSSKAGTMASDAQQAKLLQPAHATLMQLLCHMLTHSVCVKASGTQQPASMPVAPAAVAAAPQQPPLVAHVPPEAQAPEVDTAATRSLESYIPLAVQRFGPDIINRLESFLRIVERASGTGLHAALSNAVIHVTSMCFMSADGHPVLELLSTGYASGSKEQKRLYSLMCTLLKFSTWMARQPGSKGLPVQPVAGSNTLQCTRKTGSRASAAACHGRQHHNLCSSGWPSHSRGLLTASNRCWSAQQQCSLHPVSDWISTAELWSGTQWLSVRGNSGSCEDNAPPGRRQPCIAWNGRVCCETCQCVPPAAQPRPDWALLPAVG